MTWKRCKKGGAALTAVLTTAALLFSPSAAMAQEIYEGGDQPFYMKKDGLYQYCLDGSGTAKLADVINSETDNYLIELASQSLDGRYTLYFKNYDYYGDSGILCYRDSQNPGVEQVIGENIAGAFFLDNTRIIYGSADDSPVHTYVIGQGLQDDLDLSNAYDLYISPDRTKIVWTTYDRNMYTRNLYTADLSGGGFQKRLLDSDVRYVEVSDDLMAICYESDDKLYRIMNLGDRQEIAADVYDYEMVEETGSIYYLSNPSNSSGPGSSAVEQWFEDDMAVSDASLEIPDKALYHTAVTALDGSVNYVLDKDRYYEALEQYYGKLKRDELREWVEYYEYYGYNSYSYASTGYDLYYFNGQGSSKVCSNVRDLNTLGNRRDAATVNYTASRQMPHYKMSEITDTKAFIENLKMQYYYNESDLKIILGGSMTDFIVPLKSSNGQEPPQVAFYDLDNTQYLFYYLYDWLEDGTGTLKSVTYSNGTWGEPQVIDTGVAGISVGSGGMVYQKDYNKAEETTSLFSYPQGLVDSGVEDALWSNGTLYYFKNIDPQNVTATLYCWRNNKSSLISDGVREFQPFSNGSVAVYKDYNKQEKAGSLYLWNENAGAVLMDSGVVKLKDSIYGDYYYYRYYEDYEY